MRFKMMFKNKEMVLYIYPDGTQKYVFVEKKENSDSEKKQAERRTLNADAMARALFGDN